MIQVTIFGGHEGRLQPQKKIYLTLFGACEITRPTIARQILARRQRERERKPEPGGAFFFTLCGAAGIVAPTLAEEFLDLQAMIREGMLRLEDWDRAVAELAGSGSSVSSLTLMAGFSECELPDEDQEIDSLAIQRHLGNISASAGEVLQYGVGQKDAERCAVLRRAAIASA